MPGPAKPRSLAYYLGAFAVVLAIPPLLFAGYVTYQYAWSEWHRLEAVAVQRNEDLVADLDRLIAARVSVLQALATSPAIDAGDFQRFDAQARQFIEQGIEIRMRDRDGQIVIDTSVMRNAPLSRDMLLPSHLAELDARRPHITDLFVSRISGQHAVAISVPVIRGAEVRYALTTAFSPDYLQRFIADRGIGPPYSASIADRTGRIIARSARSAESIGKILPGFSDVTGDRGIWHGTNPDGILVSAYFNRSELSGWFISTGVNRHALELPMRDLLLRLMLLGAGVLVVSVGAATLLARRLRLASTALTAAADAVGTGQLAVAPQTSVAEANRIGSAFARASLQLQEQARALEQANRDLEERVEQRTRQLTVSEERYRLLAENSTDLILLREARGRIAFASPSCLRLLGYSVPEMLNLTPDDLVHPDEVERIRAISRSLGPGKPSAFSIHRLRHKGGHWVWVQSAYSHIAGSSADAPTIMAIVRDDTERQLHELKLRHSNEALQQFSAIVSHDLQAPLRHINMYSDMLQARVGAGDADAASYAARIMTSVARMQRQIRSLFVYSQVAYATVKSEDVPLERVVAEAITLLDAQIRESGARIEAAGLPVVKGDPDLLVTLFQNLIANAVKYRGDRPPTVSLSAQPSGAFWEITIEDDGIGIDPQYAERIFEIFRRLHRDESRYAGMGLGLALCRRIVESHDGQIWLDAGYSHGARFRFTLPRR